MTRRSKVWRVLVVLFIIFNVAGAVYAAALSEAVHLTVHLGLLVLGAYFARRIWRWGAESAIPDHFHEFTDRLTHVEQSVDAVAIELERIGEGQRFITRLFTEKGTPRAPGEGAAEPIEIKAHTT